MTEPDLVVTAAVRIPADELRWRFSRSSGPGGQGVNTTDSRVVLGWDATVSTALHGLGEGVRERALERLAPRSVDGVVTIAASQFRSQLRNRGAARARLVELVREAVAPPPAVRRRTRPTRGSQLRRLAGKQRRAQVKRLRRGEE